MTFKRYLFLMGIITLLCWGGWLWVLFFVNPYEGGNLAEFIFYGLLLLSLWGSFNLFGDFLILIRPKGDFFYRRAKVSARRSFWLALWLVSILFLQARALLVWWNALLLFILLAGMEFWIIFNINLKNRTLQTEAETSAEINEENKA